MNNDTKTINGFLKKNREFSKITRQGKELVVRLQGSDFEYKVSDFTLSSEIRAKLEGLQADLGIPIS